MLTSLFLLCCSCGTGHGLGSQVPLLVGLAQEIMQDFPDAAAETVEQALVQALSSAAAREEVQTSELMCLRDYTNPCPIGWMDRGDGATCSAPPNYQGICSKVMKFGGLTPVAKRRLASECGAEFGCSGQQPQDFATLCPALWKKDVDHSCIAPGDYDGPCIGRKDFVGMTSEEKAAWGRRCGVAWPPRKTIGDLQHESASFRSTLGACQIDYSGVCPEGWSLDGHKCVAPFSYDGLCGPSMRMSFTFEQKKAFQSSCDAPWPCA